MYDRVLVKRTEHEQTDGGLFVPLHASARRNLRGKYAGEGVVRGVGLGLPRDDGTFRPPDVKVGDRVFFPTWVAMKVLDVEGEELVELAGDDLVARVEYVAGELSLLRPLRHRVLLFREAALEKVGLIFMPESAKPPQTKARVLDVGTGYAGPQVSRDRLAFPCVRAFGADQPLDLRIGERVLIAENGGTEIRIDDKLHFVMREADVLGAIPEELEQPLRPPIAYAVPPELPIA